MRQHRYPVWFFVSLVGAWSLLMIVEIVGAGGVSSLSAGEARDVVANLGRAHNQLVSVVLVSVALAIPITASNYTPKLLGLFLTDRIHISVLTSYALAAVHANWAMLLARDGPVSQLLVGAVMGTTAVGFFCVIPYFFYVIWFLEPTSVVRRIHLQGLGAIESVARGRDRVHAREALAQTIHNLGSMVLKAIDRLDRQSAATGIVAIREVLSAYGDAKPDLDREWFRATKHEFRGLSRDALSFISADRCWVEIIALQDLNLVFEASLRRMPDAVVSLADSMRGIGIDAYARQDIPVLDNVARAFNSLIRSAITHGEPHAIFDVLTQYRALAEECLPDRPLVAIDGARQMRHYAVRARQAGMVFIPELFAYDVGAMLTHAVETESAYIREMLAEFLNLFAALADRPSPPLACAGLVTLGNCYDLLPDANRDALADAVIGLPRDVLEIGLSVLDRTDSPRYHELTARQVDLNFLPPQRIEQVRALVDARQSEPTR